jgi:hypothetical protein
MVDRETCSAGLVPSCSFCGVGTEVGKGGGVGLSHPSREERGVVKNFLIEAVFSKEGNARVAL